MIRLIPISTIVASSCWRLVASWVRAAGTSFSSIVSSSRLLTAAALDRQAEPLTRSTAALSSTPSRSLHARLSALLARVDSTLEQVGELVDEVVAALVDGDVLVAELVQRLGDVGHQRPYASICSIEDSTIAWKTPWTRLATKVGKLTSRRSAPATPRLRWRRLRHELRPARGPPLVARPARRSAERRRARTQARRGGSTATVFGDLSLVSGGRPGTASLASSSFFTSGARGRERLGIDVERLGWGRPGLSRVLVIVCPFSSSSGLRSGVHRNRLPPRSLPSRATSNSTGRR